MPKVPTYDAPRESLRSVGKNQLNVRITPDAMGADLAEGVSKITDTYARLKDEERKRNAMDSYNRTMEEINKTIQSDYKMRKGKAAKGLYEESSTYIDEMESKGLSELADDKEREIFQQLFTPTKLANKKEE
jgi:hypothetical protein